MLLIQRPKGLSILTIAMLFAAAGCGEDGGNDPDNPTPEDVLTDGLTKIPQMNEGIARLVLTLQGNPQPGVTLTPITNGVQGTLGFDLDDNGSMETSVVGSLVYIDPNVGISGGATLTITDIDGPGDNIDGTLFATVTPIGPSDVAITSGNGSLDTPAGDLDVQSFDVSLSFGAPNLAISGFSQFVLAGDVGTLAFNDDGNGNQLITLDYQGEVISVP